MSLLYGFYDSLDGDRTYNSETFSIPFSHIIAPGVFANYGAQYRVTAGDGMTVNVAKGASWWGDTWTRLDEPLLLTFGASDASLGRVDRVVLRHDKRPSVRSNFVTILRGVPAGAPIPTTLTNSGGISDMLIADVKIPAGSTGIVQNNITYYVGKSKTPFVTAPMTSVDISPIVSDLNGQFNDWFQTIQSLLAGDVAANLAQQTSDLAKANTDLAARIKALETKPAADEKDTGWIPVTVNSSWKQTGEFSARVLGKGLYFAGTFQRVAKPTVNADVALPILDWPPAIKNALTSVGWGAMTRGVGSFASPTGFAGELFANSTSLLMSYRTRNPNAGEWMTGHITGAIT